MAAAPSEVQEHVGTPTVVTTQPLLFAPTIIVESVSHLTRLADDVIRDIAFRYGPFQVVDVCEDDACLDDKARRRIRIANAFSLVETTLAKPAATRPRILLRRFHLWEAVYAPLGRGYNADFAFQLEEEFIQRTMNSRNTDVRLVLLTETPEDGPKMRETQNELLLMADAFQRSKFQKTIVPVPPTIPECGPDGVDIRAPKIVDDLVRFLTLDLAFGGPKPETKPLLEAVA